MELREIIEIFKKQQTFYTGVILISLFGSWIWQKEQSVAYQATLLINIGRDGASQTVDYAYDSFYRLQADERFADTVVRWLSSPRVVEDIYREARLDSASLGLKGLSGVFTAGRLSSQVIAVKYSGENEEKMRELAVAAVTVLNRYTDTLNTEGRDTSWFVVIGSDPVIRDGRISINLALFAGLALGVFIGFWGVLLRHYLKSGEKEK